MAAWMATTTLIMNYPKALIFLITTTKWHLTTALCMSLTTTMHNCKIILAPLLQSADKLGVKVE